jgi:LysM repeat protein
MNFEKFKMLLTIFVASLAMLKTASTAQLVGGPLGVSNAKAGFNVMGLGQTVSVLSDPSAYTIVAGDTLYNIASSFNVSLACLESSNPQITDPDLIFPGQNIIIPSSEEIISYKVMEGDYLAAIAAQFGVTLGDLEQANPQIADPNLIYPGDIMNVPNVCSSNVKSNALFPCGDAFYHLDMVSIVITIYCIQYVLSNTFTSFFNLLSE